MYSIKLGGGPPGDYSGSSPFWGGSGSTDSSIETIERVTHPKLYRVILLNDDFTPMDFVIMVLQRFFSKTQEQATQVMLDVHQKGSGIAGVYTLEIAEMKVMQVNKFSRSNQYPLKCILEPEHSDEQR